MNLAEWAAPHRSRIDGRMLAAFDDAWPPRFQEACRYPLATGGKRVRALLVLAAAEALGHELDDNVVGAAAAVELVHSYSLVHDDLPCMDDDDERRGRPTVHKVYTDGVAVLVGDALLTEAFRLLSRLSSPPEQRLALIATLTEAAGHVGMIGGQAADVGMGGAITEIGALEQLHRGKTGALIAAAVRMGGLVSGATPAQLAALQTYGEALGLAFQLADDVLDAEEDAVPGGPPSYLKLLGLDETRRRARLLSERAYAAVTVLPDPTWLLALARFTVERDH